MIRRTKKENKRLYDKNRRGKIENMIRVTKKQNKGVFNNENNER